MVSESRQPVEILSVEDNPADARMILELFKMSSVKTTLNFVKDGAEALDYLFQRNAHQNAIRPDLILLDLNLPKIDGKEILKLIKEDVRLRSIPILVLTTSDTRSDINQCYDLHANCYFTKPSDLYEFNTTVKAIEDCWLATACLPQVRSLPA